MIHHLIKYRLPVSIIFFLLYFFLLSQSESLFSLDAGLPSLLALGVLLAFWAILLYDMIRTRIYQKTFWILSMFLFSWLAPAIYLFQRKTLGHIKTNKFARSQE